MVDGWRVAELRAVGRPSRLARCYSEDTPYWLAGLAERYDPTGVFRLGQVARFRP